jgi:hypothetical protein
LNPLFRIWALYAMGVLAGSVGPQVAWAGPTVSSPQAREVPSRSRVSVEVMMVHATDGGAVHPDLQPLMQQLRFTRYTGFDLLNRFPAQMAVGSSESFTLVGGRKLKIDLISKGDKNAKLRVRLFSEREKVLDTTISVHRNRSFIIGGPKYKGGALVLPLTVKY